MNKKMTYQWNLRQLMATRGMFATTDLVPLLADRGIHLSREQVFRLVTTTPQRLSLDTLAALCDILDVGVYRGLCRVAAPAGYAHLPHMRLGCARLLPDRQKPRVPELRTPKTTHLQLVWTRERTPHTPSPGTVRSARAVATADAFISAANARKKPRTPYTFLPPLPIRGKFVIVKVAAAREERRTSETLLRELRCRIARIDATPWT